MTEWSSLELKVISCSNLKAFSLFKKLSVYSVVFITNGESKKKEYRQNCLQMQKTQTDREGGGNPEWNHMMKFGIKDFVDDCSHLFLAFDLYSQGIVNGNRSIGKVRVPLEQLIYEFNGAAMRFVMYQVRTRHGKPNGSLRFCYNLSGRTINNKGELPSSPEVCSSANGTHFSRAKVCYPPYVEVDDLPSPAGICYPSLDYVDSPLQGFYSHPPKHEYEGNYRTTLPQLSPLLQVSSPMVGSGSYYQPCPWCVHSPWPWHHVQSTGYGNAYDWHGHLAGVKQIGATEAVNMEV